MNVMAFFIDKNGEQREDIVPIEEVLKIPIGGIFITKVGFGFQPIRFYEKISEYKFKEILMPK